MKLVEDQLAEERATKSSLESRGIGVVSTSGALLTLLFGLSAVITDADGYQLPLLARWLLVGATVVFFGAVVLGLLAARPSTYSEVTVTSLTDITGEAAMQAPAAQGERAIAEALVKIIVASRTANGTKATRLRWAITAQVVAAAVVAATVSVILIRG